MAPSPNRGLIGGRSWGNGGAAGGITMRTARSRGLTLATAAALALAGSAMAQTASPTAPDDGRFAWHVQSTFVAQGQGDVASPYSGANSLSAKANARETWDVTLYAGLRLWEGAELWANPEIDQGFGLSDTLGAAGFPSGEAYKVGAAEPYLRLQRAFFRQTINLGARTEAADADLNQFAAKRAPDRLVFTFGKFSVGDIFDANAYAHDPRQDFLNWTVIDGGAFDYAADAWGYSAGGALEWYRGRWTLRGGAFLLSNVPNSANIDTRFKQFQLIGEVEERHTIKGRPGRLRLTGFLSRGRMGRLEDAAALAARTASTPDAAAVRRYARRPGFSLGLEQEVAEGVGVFARAAFADGRYEAYEFTDVDRSWSGGLSVSGKRWGRDGDTVGVAGVINEASRQRLDYLAAGGLGILIGDGALPHPDSERIVEAYYALGLVKGVQVTADLQRIENPGYNADRGPATVFALRLHAQY